MRENRSGEQAGFFRLQVNHAYRRTERSQVIQAFPHQSMAAEIEARDGEAHLAGCTQQAY